MLFFDTELGIGVFEIDMVFREPCCHELVFNSIRLEFGCGRYF